MMPFAERLKILRDKQESKYVAGNYVRGPRRLIDFMGTVEPLSGDDLMLLSEGDRTKESIRIWTETELRTVDGKREADYVIYCGRKFEVQIVKKWTQLIPHYQVIAVRINDENAGD